MNSMIKWVDDRFPLMKMWNEHLAEYYASKNLNFWYFFGSLALLVLVIQIVSGIFLVMHYKPDAAALYQGDLAYIRDEVTIPPGMTAHIVLPPMFEPNLANKLVESEKITSVIGVPTMYMMMLEGKVAIVTGASTGLGQGMTLGLIEAGATVVGVDYVEMPDTAKLCEERGGLPQLRGMPLVPVH